MFRADRGLNDPSARHWAHLMTQIWDVSVGVGAPVVAEKDVPLSAEGSLKLYRGREERPVNPETSKWFDNLMIE